MSGASSTRHALARVLGLFGPYRRHVLLLVLAIFVSAALGIAFPLLTKIVFDQALFPSSGEPRLGLLSVLVAAMVAVVVAGGVIAIGQTYLATVVGQHVMHDLRERLYAHLQRMSLRFFTGVRTGEIQARINYDVAGVGGVVSEGAATLVADAVFVVVSLSVMAMIAWQLTLVSLVVLPAFVYLSHRIGSLRRQLASRTQDTLTELSVITEETLSVSGALLTKVFDRQEDMVDRYGDESRRLAELSVRQQMVGRTVLGLAQTFFLVAPALVYLVAGYTAAGSSVHFSPGTLVAFTALQMRLFLPVRELMDRWIELQASLGLFERIFQYLDLTPEISDSARARELDPSAVRGEIAFRDISFRYAEPRDDRPAHRPWALEGVTFTIEPGQLAAIVGPSGAGKTTITYLIARLYDVTRGGVTVDGIDVRNIRLASLAGIVGMVTQETTLFHASVRDNLLYAKPDATPEELEAAARAALVHKRILELDDGYDTIVGERGYRMSGGEKQRLAIARAILRDPRILILDEATSALDTTSERLVQRALEPLMADRTTIAIAHRLSTILTANVILVLDRGRLVEQGTHAELVARGGLYAQLYEQQFQGGLLEARCEDGLVLSSGGVVRAAGAEG